MKPGTAVAITDPFVKYTSLIATGVYQPDAAQYRLAHHLQKVYTRLKDYTPSQEYRRRIGLISKAIEDTHAGATGRNLASPTHPIRRNPLLARFFSRHDATTKETMALARVLTNHEAALHIDSPKGLFLSGEVGTGKSMLLDLLADGLPTRHKRRWHFNTFMLHALSRLEAFRKSRPHLSSSSLSSSGSGPEYPLLWLAKELVETSPILFLDEFQLPDRAASKIMSHLFIAFFQLGGVLVASSNRMPEELEKATGGYYTPPATGGLLDKLFGASKARFAGELYGSSSDFAAFLEVLKARCDFWHMEGTRDWRQQERWDASVSKESASLDDVTAGGNSNIKGVSLPGTDAGQEPTNSQESNPRPDRPAMYFSPSDGDETWNAAIQRVISQALSSHNPHPEPLRLPWQPATLTVYGHRLEVPKQYSGISLWDFSDLVSTLGPADYVTLASNYHTFIIDRVPVLTLSMKNEARRFITLLDALYEARCKLLMRAPAGPDQLFFPETRQRAPGTVTDTTHLSENDTEPLTDATYSETIAEIYQDQTVPFRPNIATYSDNPDQDPAADPSKTETSQQAIVKADFTKTAAVFTGQDERFAYKRAASRLWEMCSARWHARSGEGWWMPLPRDARHWEGGDPSRPLGRAMDERRMVTQGEGMGGSVVLEEPAGLQGWRVRELMGR
ncbi:hypothetical protein VTJ04DRAFT_9704 [Mycothermus thermophilus]|uniref:uncharacterized protein n=1 Tax=Humicola insolens TaxID=85995 RepID=UPI003742FF62